jgi:hypothetical protein
MNKDSLSSTTFVIKDNEAKLKEPFDTIDPNKFNTMWIRDIDSPNFVFSIIKRDETDTNKKYIYKNIDGYYIFNHIPPERIQEGKEDWEVTYSFNNELFRSDHFKKDHGGLHLLFGGCSNTEGVGSNIEDNWSYLLYKDISKHTKTSGFFSIAKGGYGWHQIFLNFKVYVEKYGAPDYYFVLHPNLLRYYEWQESEIRWKYVQRNEVEYSPINWRQEHHAVFPNWASAMSLFIAYCESVGTKLLWTTWDKEEHKNIANSNFFNSTYFEAYRFNKNTIEIVRPDGKLAKDDISFRDGHPGKIAQELWYKSFKDELIKKGLIFNE